MKRLSSALLGLACAAVVWAGLSAVPQAPAVEAPSRGQAEAIREKYGLTPPVTPSPLQAAADTVRNADRGWSWKP